jgi:N-acetylated-alpha-linked acidic dipeptidase
LKRAFVLVIFFTAITLFAQQASDPASGAVFGFRDFSKQHQWDQKFIAVPDPAQAEEDLRILTSAPHVAGSPEDKKTADYVAQKFREAGLETAIVEYKVWMNRPAEVSFSATAPASMKFSGPSREHVSSDPASFPASAGRLHRATWKEKWFTPTTARPRISRNWKNRRSTCAERS